MLWTIIGIIVSYLIGSIPTAYIFGMILKGVDIRKVGSGNVGATNASRLLGKKIGLLILALDILKGFLAVTLLGSFINAQAIYNPRLIRVLLGFSCISGHNWTIFLRFKGGKGVATTLGVLAGLAVTITELKFVLSLLIFTWLLVFVISKYVSLASLAAGITLPLYMLIYTQSRILIISSIIISCFIILRHTSNLKRLLKGEEHRFNFKKSK